MNATTPTVFEPKPIIKDGEASIAVAVVSIAENFSALSANMLQAALLSGVQRNGVAVTRHGDYFLNRFAANIITVPVDGKPAALSAIRATLNELHLLEAATIATYTDDQIWLTIQAGIAVAGATNFEALFIRPEYLEQARSNLREMEKTHVQKIAAGTLELFNMLAKADGQKS